MDIAITCHVVTEQIIIALTLVFTSGFGAGWLTRRQIHKNA